MRAKTIAADPTRVKPCKGCGLPKVVTEFHPDTDGYPQGRCKPCQRAYIGDWYRQRYHTDAEFRETEKLMATLRYRTRRRCRALAHTRLVAA